MPKDQPDFYPLSPMQEGILFHVMENPGTDMYLDQVGYPIAGSLDVAAFEKAWLYVIDRHAALRTSFLTPKNTPPIQVVHQKSAIAVKTLDWRQMSPAQQEEELAAFLASDRAASFDIGSGPLMRLTLIVRADSLFYFNWTWHHILMDGWSSSIVISEVTAAYQAYAKNEAPNFKPARPYREFIRWLTTRDLRGAEDYWRQLLSGANRARSFPLSDFEIETEGGHLQGDGAIRLTAEFTEKLDKYARSNRVTLNSVVQFAWAVLLGAYTNNDDVIFGSVVSGRPASLAGVEAMVGLFINTLPVRLKLTQSTNVMNAIRDLQSQQVRSREYDYTPLVKIQKCSDVPAGSALFDTIIAFENFAGGVTPPQRAEGNQLTIAANRNSDHVNYPVSVVVVPGAELIIHICYDASRFSRSFVDRLLSHFQVLLQTVASSKGGTVKDLSLHGEPELQPRRSWLNHPDQGESQVHVSQMILAAAEGRPSAVAWVSGGKRISYGQLAKDCLHLAGRLRAAGAGPSSSVGVHLHRVEDRVLAILALLVFGAPLREEVRPTGNGSSEKDSEPDIWIVDTPGGGLRTLKPCINLRTLDSPEGDLGDWASLPLDPQALVCSSPLPQRKPITSQLICQRIGFLQSNIGLNQNDVVLHRCSSSFDLFVKEVLWPLTRGAQVVLCEDADLRQVRQRVVEDRVTVLTGPESELAFWLDPEQLGSDSDRPVRMMLCTGEPLSKAAARKLSGPHAIEVWVGFTPPETATEAALEVYSSGVRRRVSTTVDLQLLDKWHRLVPADVPGDVYIVASGNAPSFSGDSHDSIPLQHPLLAGSEQLQPTGDVGAIREDGSLRLLDGPGRCWIDGIAIDLPAIEAILLKHGAVVDCAVRAVTDDQHRRRLVAFCAFQEPAAAAKVERQIRETLAPEKLPAIVPVMRIPRLRDGSVDESELAYVPIVSTTLAREVAAQLRTDPAVVDAAVVTEVAARPLPRLHVDELLVSRRQGPITALAAKQPGEGVVLEGPPCDGPPSIAHGAALVANPARPSSLANMLYRSAFLHPNAGVKYLQPDGSEIHQSYADLLDLAMRIAGGLKKCGVCRQDRVILLLAQPKDFVPAFWACVVGGFVPVPCSVPVTFRAQEAASAKVQGLVELLQPAFILTTEDLLQNVLSLGAIQANQLLCVSEVVGEIRHMAGPGSTPDSIAMLLPTSGSSGAPKCVIQTQSSVLAWCDSSIQANGFTNADVSFNWMPMDHVGALLH